MKLELRVEQLAGEKKTKDKSASLELVVVREGTDVWGTHGDDRLKGRFQVDPLAYSEHAQGQSEFE